MKIFSDDSNSHPFSHSCQWWSCPLHGFPCPLALSGYLYPLAQQLLRQKVNGPALLCHTKLFLLCSKFQVSKRTRYSKAYPESSQGLRLRAQLAGIPGWWPNCTGLISVCTSMFYSQKRTSLLLWNQGLYLISDLLHKGSRAVPTVFLFDQGEATAGLFPVCLDLSELIWPEFFVFGKLEGQKRWAMLSMQRPVGAGDYATFISCCCFSEQLQTWFYILSGTSLTFLPNKPSKETRDIVLTSAPWRCPPGSCFYLTVSIFQVRWIACVHSESQQGKV